ncbi:hypothetical protein Nisw_06630 [Candidatus Nitrosopumilus sp. SW]|uniref:hypothetical protein n=1 Tax=Candidatus Nitrosopumilus sp. SW TaxID=2508726 RepID=UPI00114E206B|nr:hypothetical protein [Candidatus Nitrosopumilus sp. SW]QDI89220.1 hypothetical protein Nisw_06630 [Candidatus Nitrosopumilus sp. SW]
MSLRKPRIRKPKIPKLKKPLVRKRKTLKKKVIPTTIKKTRKTTKKHNTKRTTKTQLGTCYLQKGCRQVISKNVTKTKCKLLGGKSWKKKDGNCEVIR